MGAGTVLDAPTVDRAAAAGAQFIVAPGYNATVVARARELGLAVIPGAVTPTEIERALADGIALVKFFPAEAAGGVPYLRAVSAPYRTARFMPTGGVTPANLATYLALPSVVACGGTWIAPADAIRDHRWADITASAAEACAIVAALRADHLVGPDRLVVLVAGRHIPRSASADILPRDDPMGIKSAPEVLWGVCAAISSAADDSKTRVPPRDAHTGITDREEFRRRAGDGRLEGVPQRSGRRAAGRSSAAGRGQSVMTSTTRPSRADVRAASSTEMVRIPSSIGTGKGASPRTAAANWV